VSVIVLEKEHALARHQTGHNSGVIHSGVYYKPGSAKARTCIRGGALCRKFCDEHAVRYDECGKIIVARDEAEILSLEEPHPNEVILQTTAGDLRVRNYIACAGLHSDRAVRLSGARPEAQIVPFRGILTGATWPRP